ncbi:MAG: hypothetical protein R2856_09825 [Caldilineaceae bacterium]
MAQRLAEIVFAEELANDFVALAGDAQALGLVQFQVRRQIFGAPVRDELGIGFLSTAQSFDKLARGILQVGVITATGQCTQGTADAAGTLLVNGFVDVQAGCLPRRPSRK